MAGFTLHGLAFPLLAVLADEDVGGVFARYGDVGRVAERTDVARRVQRLADVGRVFEPLQIFG